MSYTLAAAGGAPGIAFGRAVRLVHATPAAADPPGEPPDAALARFAAAQAAAAARLRALADRQRAAGLADEAGIFEAHALLAEDETLTEHVTELVRHEGQPLGLALAAAITQMHAALDALDDAYLRERAADITAVGQELRHALYGASPPLADVPHGAIIVAPDLTPAETAELPPHVAGFATAYGGPTGHTAILARARGVPAVVGLGEAALAIPDGVELIVDGGVCLIIEPTADEQAAYRQRAAEQQAARERRAALRAQPGRLKDGRAVALWANIGHSDEARAALDHGAEGIGLFRTEFLFLDRRAPPDEEEQYRAYCAVLEALAGRTVVVRTIDIGGDKPVPYLQQPPEANPFLGVRALRLCMRRPDLFATQMRALLRAARHGDLWIMLPMVATPDDLQWGREQLRTAAAALAAAGVEHRPNPPLGIMIETPAAAVTADLLARDAAFFSIGSNDLTQYAMAADRGQAELAARYPHNAPAVFRLVARAAEAAHAAGIPIGICGELAADPDAAVALAGLGLDELSMAPASIPLVKERLAATTEADAQAAARRALG
jgi:phosphotransferase system enzyme I (PtsI)